MTQRLLHTPEGVRDIYQLEYKKKLVLEKRLEQVLHSYGYQDIQTPTFEYFEVFSKEIGTIPSNELYKFFDKEGDTLVLRPDITPSIARAAATCLEYEHMPMRLCYKGNTFVNHTSYQGRMKENTQLGAECIGIATEESDAEMVAMAVDCMKKAGLKEFQINIGNVVFFESLIEETDLNQEEEQRLRTLIANRNFFGVDSFLETHDIKPNIREAFRLLPELFGGMECLQAAKEIAPNMHALAALKRLEQIYEFLTIYHVEKHITFDLSMSGTYGYYTGIIFRGYTFGTGDAVIKGGRYDHLLEKFGKAEPSIGFAVYVDELLNALSRQKIKLPIARKNTLVLYDARRKKEAVALSNQLRKSGKKAELLKRETDIALDTYYEYGKRNLAGAMIYLKENEETMAVNLLTNEVKIINGEA